MEALICAIYRCGHVLTWTDDSVADTMVIGLETKERRFYVRDTLPVEIGSSLYRIAVGISGYSCFAAEVKPDEFLGKPLLVELVLSDAWAVVKKAEPWPVPRTRPTSLVMTSTQSRLTGRPEGERHVIGGERSRDTNAYPPAPTPRAEPRRWSVDELTKADLPHDLPLGVAELVRRSTEWQELVEATPTPARRK